MGKEMHPFSLLLARLEVPLLAPRRNAGLRGVPVCSQVVMMGRQEICTVHLREGEVSPKSDIETHEGTRSPMFRVPRSQVDGSQTSGTQSSKQLHRTSMEVPLMHTIHAQSATQ